MKKTIDINMAGQLLHLDEDAYRLLQRYLDALERHLGKTEGSDEILADVEARFAEIFQENMGTARNVVNQKDVEAAIALLGRPEDFAGESTWDPEFESSSQPADLGRERRFYRDDDNRVVGGVAAGIAAYFGWDPVLVRVAFIFITMVGMMGIPIYIVLWIVTPKAVTRAEKMAMRGEPVTVDNIRRKVEDEFHEVRDRMESQDVGGRVKRGAGSFWDWFKDIFVKVLKFFLTLFALCLMLSMLAVGVAIFAAAFGGDIAWQQEGWGNHDIALADLANLVLPVGYSLDFLLLSSLLLVLAPITFIVLLNLRVFLGMRWNRPAPKVLMFVSGVASLCGMIMLFVLGARTATEFMIDNESDQIARFDLLEEQKEWHLKMVDLQLEGAHFEFRAEDVGGRTRITINDSVIEDEDHDDFDGVELFYLEDGQVYVNHVDVDVRQTKEVAPYIQIQREAKGPNRRAAAYRAGRIEYDVEWSDDGLIQLNNLLNFPEKDRFRGQQVEVVLYLPVGHSVYLDYSTVDYLDDVKNQENMWDHHMGGRTWIMMPEGLTEVKPF